LNPRKPPRKVPAAKMRFYTIHRFGTMVRYAQIPKDSPQVACVSIPHMTPTLLDPFLLWKETSNTAQIKHIAIQDKSGVTWLELKCATPINKLMNLSIDVMRVIR
jgi:hypothetical protein